MAGITIKRIDKFPVGTSVDAYATGGLDRWPGSPPGAIVESATMTATGAVFSALQRAPYFFHAVVSSVDQVVLATAGEDGGPDNVAHVNEVEAITRTGRCVPRAGRREQLLTCRREYGLVENRSVVPRSDVQGTMHPAALDRGHRDGGGRAAAGGALEKPALGQPPAQVDDVARRAPTAVIRQHDAEGVLAEGVAQLATGPVQGLVDPAHRSASDPACVRVVAR